MYETLNELKKKLDALRPLNQDQIAAMDRVLIPRRIYFTNAFEDNSLTLEETRYYLETQRMVGGKLEREFHEIKGVWEAIQYLRSVSAQSGDLNEKVILELHRILTSPIDQDQRYLPGVYKTRDIPILGKDGSRINFVPYDQVPAQMALLLEWYQNNRVERHPVELAANFHFRFTLIHPFMDGNGRVARLLNDFIMENAGYGPVLLDDRNQYFEAIRKAEQSLPGGIRDIGNLEVDLSAMYQVLEKGCTNGISLMLDVLEDRLTSEVSDLEARLEIFDRIISGDATEAAYKRDQEAKERGSKETTKLAIAREVGETLKEKVHSKFMQFLLSGPAKFQQNNSQYSPLIAEITARHSYVYAPSESLYEYHLSPNLVSIEEAGMPIKPFMKLLSFAILSSGREVGIFSALLEFEFGKIYIKQENRNELVLRLQPESIREMVGPISYQDWNLAELKRFLFNSLDNYFHRIEKDYLAVTNSSN
jgi:fido (protein-threonine AMPylation protein)